ncbi:hypothetical protein PENSPDRAFT_692898 [Peniophora sp. CONT]|nr:hypothetical protein PENSPDRAFT_692898 [Peniophora sp. CONT]
MTLSIFYSLAAVLLAANLAIALPNGSAFAARSAHHRRAQALAAREPATDLAKSLGDLGKSFQSARWTYYSTGLGACGGTNQDSDYIVALNSAQWDGGKHCYEKIHMNYGGKSTTAMIVDECPGCPHGGLDLSPGLFQYFGPQSEGVLTGSWTYGDGDSAPPPPPPAPKPSPKPQPTTQVARIPLNALPSSHTSTFTQKYTPSPSPTTYAQATHSTTPASYPATSASTYAAFASQSAYISTQYTNSTSTSGPPQYSSTATATAAPTLATVVQGVQEEGTIALLYRAVIQLGSLVEEA